MSALDRTLRAWGLATIGAPLSGGSRNEVHEGEVDGRRVVVRRGARAADALEWELDLLEHVASEGINVPVLVPALDGRPHVDGVSVWEYVDGHAPASRRDWALVAEALAHLHACTSGWPQRPGFAASDQLLTRSRGGDVRLDLMPSDLVALVRRAWRAVQQGDRSVVHGDPGPSNIRMVADHAVLLDWDEARVDVPWFDLASLPLELDLPEGLDPDGVVTAGIAWEVATCWVAEPAYAGRRAEELVRRT